VTGGSPAPVRRGCQCRARRSARRPGKHGLLSGWDPEAGGVYHIGYWVDDLAAEAKRLDALGYLGYATAGATPC
jgi:hypothetical protein